jgi:hypothetical protein
LATRKNWLEVVAITLGVVLVVAAVSLVTTTQIWIGQFRFGGYEFIFVEGNGKPAKGGQVEKAVPHWRRVVFTNGAQGRSPRRLRRANWPVLRVALTRLLGGARHSKLSALTRLTV